MVIRVAMFGAVAMAAISPHAWGETPFPSSSAVSDQELDSLRGAVLLPNGLNVAIGIDIQTRVNGELALRTVVSTEAPDGDGLRVLELDVRPNGPAVDTDLGQVDVDRNDRGTVVTLRNESLLIQHLIGRTTGVVVANTGNDRVIDTVSAIDVDLQGAWPLAANALFTVNAVASEAAVRN